MRALVTGHQGFIGSHVVESLKAAGYEVGGIDTKSGTDCRDFFKYTPSYYDVVVHCAAVVGGRKVMDWAPLDHATNLAIDASLFEWAKKTKPGRIVYFSSSCAYPVALGEYPARKFYEDDINHFQPKMPDQLYGWAKLTGEMLCETALDEGLNVTYVRPFSVYGPRSNSGFAVHAFVEQARARKDPLIIWGNDRQERDYIHVKDVAQAVIALIREGWDGPINLGTGVGTTVRQVAHMAYRAAGYSPKIEVAKDMPAGVGHLVANTVTLDSIFKPQFRLEDYIHEAVNSV